MGRVDIMISTTFDKVAVKGQSVCNGTDWVKRSKRTASIFGQPNRWFYFCNKDRVSVAEKWLEKELDWSDMRLSRTD